VIEEIVDYLENYLWFLDAPFRDKLYVWTLFGGMVFFMWQWDEILGYIKKNWRKRIENMRANYQKDMDRWRKK